VKIDGESVSLNKLVSVGSGDSNASYGQILEETSKISLPHSSQTKLFIAEETKEVT
jgi:hypothetical protein